MVRVGHLRGSEFFGGPERAIIGQCVNMAGPEFTCLSFVRGGAPNAFLEHCAAAGIATCPVPERGAGDFAVVGRIRQAIRDLELDVIVSHEYKSNVMATLAVRGTRAGHIRHFRGFTWESAKVRFYNWIDTQCMKRMARVLAVSSRSAEILAGLGVRRDAVTVVPNAIEATKLVGEDSRRQPRPERPLSLVAAGRLSPEKGQDVLVRALALVPGDVALHVDVFGDGPDEEAIRRLIAELGVQERITLRGFVDDVLPLLREADGMVLPSRSEGMPNILLEAWSQRCPVISTTVGGVPEMVEPGASGLLCPPESPAELADRLTWAARHRDELAAMGDEGYRTVRTRYTYDAQARILDGIYREAAGG